MSHVARFSALCADGASLERGQLVVVQTDRGIELGEVLLVLDGRPDEAERGDPARASEGDASSLSLSVTAPRVLRAAAPDDLARSRDAAALRPGRFSLCQRILGEESWPWDLIDVEPLLDGSLTVLHYLGPHQVEFARVRARIRVECDFDVILQPAGSDLGVESLDDDDHEHGHGHGGGCGSCGCSNAGGCGSEAAAPESASDRHQQPAPVASGCGAAPHAGCSSCGISRVKSERDRARV